MIVINDIVYTYTSQKSEYDIEIQLDNTDIKIYISKVIDYDYIHQYQKILILDKEIFLYDGNTIKFINSFYNDYLIEFYLNVLNIMDKNTIINYILNVKKELINSNDIKKYYTFKYNEDKYFFIKNKNIFKLSFIPKNYEIELMDKYLVLNAIYFKWLNGFL